MSPMNETFPVFGRVGFFAGQMPRIESALAA
jgi:hypothetical protein